MIVQTIALRKLFRVGFWGRPVEALKGLDLEVAEGEIFGFLGPNGAGKTTTLKLLTGIIRPTSGRAELFGLPPSSASAKKRLGFLPEHPYFYDFLTAEEFLEFHGRLAGLDRAAIRKRISRILERVGLPHVRGLRLRKFSKGMLQRIGLAQALIADPELVILDEPMSGLDPVGRKEVRDLILELKSEGRTVFFSSHILPDVEMICDRVGILIAGKLRSIGRLDAILTTQLGDVELSIMELDDGGRAALSDYILTHHPSAEVIDRGGRLLIRLPGEESAEKVWELAKKHGGRLLSWQVQRESLEEHLIREMQSIRERHHDETPRRASAGGSKA